MLFLSYILGVKMSFFSSSFAAIDDDNASIDSSVLTSAVSGETPTRFGDREELPINFGPVR